jgi:hypothetical protein
VTSLLNYGSAFFALAAGVFWWLSAKVKIPPIDQKLIGLTENPADHFNAMVSRSARLNARAASCAAVAAALQGIALAL